MRIKLLFSFLLISVCALANTVNPPNATISYNSPFCLYSTLEYVNLVGTAGGTFSASPAGLFIDAVTGDIHPNQSTPGTYTVTYDIPAGIDPAFSTTTTITIAYSTYPNFAQIAPICPESAPPSLPTTSPNGITGTWSPSAIDNQQTSTYVFTPDSGQCADLQTMIITVSMVQPIFTFSSYNLCIGEVPALPITSDNGVTGTWSPAIITTTGIYTFTPDPGLCASIRVETFVVSPMPNATLLGETTVCEGTAATVTFSGTPNTIVTYSVDAAANQTIILNSSGTADFTTPILTSGSHTICLLSATTLSGSCTIPLTACAVITTMSTPVIPPVANVFSCQPYVLPPLTVGNYYSNFGGTGTMLHAGDVIEYSQIIYVFAENACSQSEVSFDVSINSSPIITPLPDVAACQYYELPMNNEAGYYTAPHGEGMQLSGNIYSSQIVYLYVATGPFPYCTAEDSFYVTIIPASNPEIISDNGTHYIYVDGTTIVQPLLLDSQLSGNYTYEWFNNFEVIPGATSATYLVDSYTPEQSWSIFVRATNLDTGCVTTSGIFWVYQAPVPPPTGDVNQTFASGATLADIVVSGQNIQWYNVFNRNATSNPLPLNTPLVEGVTYYATQTINGFESASAFEITIQFLANNTFAFTDLEFNPNPVRDVLYIQSKDLIEDVTVFNIMGQKIFQQNFDSLDLRLQLSQLKAGNYFVKLESDNKSQVIKVIKN